MRRTQKYGLFLELYFPLKVRKDPPHSCSRWMHLGRNVTYEGLLSQSVFYQVLNVVNDRMFKRKCLLEKWYLILKGHWKYDVITSERLDIKLRAEKTLCTFLSYTKHPSEWYEISCMNTVVYQYYKKTYWKCLFLRRKMNCHVLRIAKAHFNYPRFDIIRCRFRYYGARKYTMKSQ